MRVAWNKGRACPEEMKKRISDTLKGRKLSAETKAKMIGRIPWNKDMKMSEEHCQKLSDSHKGQIRTEDQKIRTSKTLKIWYRNNESRNKGRKQSKEVKKKVKAAWRRKILNGWVNHSLGKELSKEHKMKISLANKGNNIGSKNGMFGKKGKLHPNFIEGNKEYSLDWTNTLKKSIRQRDNYTCRLCGEKQRRFVEKHSVHHIDYY